MELKTYFRKGENLFGVGSLLILAVQCFGSSSATSSLPRF